MTTFPVPWTYAVAEKFGGQAVLWTSVGALVGAMLVPPLLDRSAESHIARRHLAVVILMLTLVGFALASYFGYHELSDAIEDVGGITTAAPSTAPMQTSPEETGPDFLGAQALFVDTRARCHGETGAGTGRASSLLALPDISAFEQAWDAAHASGSAASDNFSESDRRALWQWLQSLKSR